MKPLRVRPGVQKALALVISKNQRVKGPGADRVSADHELLTLIQAHLLPCAGALARLVSTVPPFGNDTLQSLRLNRLNDVLEARIQAGRRGPVL